METIGRDLIDMQRVPLSASHVEAIRAVGKEVEYPAGTILARPGDRIRNFIYVLEGEIEVMNTFTGERLVAVTLGPTQFMAEISFLAGGSWSIGSRAVRDVRVVEVERGAHGARERDRPERAQQRKCRVMPSSSSHPMSSHRSRAAGCLVASLLATVSVFSIRQLRATRSSSDGPRERTITGAAEG